MLVLCIPPNRESILQILLNSEEKTDDQHSPIENQLYISKKKISLKCCSVRDYYDFSMLKIFLKDEL